MLFLTNFLIVVGGMAILCAYFFGVNALAEWACDKWEEKGLLTVWGALVFLPMMVLFALGMTYGS